MNLNQELQPPKNPPEIIRLEPYQNRSFSNVIRSGLKILFIIGLAAVIVIARDVLLMAFLSVLLAVLLSFPVDLLSKKITS